MSNDFPIVQEYMDFLFATEADKIPFVTKDRIDKNFENYCTAMNTLLIYPDILSDIMTPRDSVFSMFFQQRIVLRAMSRFSQCFFTFTRAFSKSFLAFYQAYQKCMFLPRSKVFVVAGTKTQAALIAREKVIDDLWVKFPMFANEMQKFRRGGKLKDPFTDSGDSVQFNFSNGSIFDVIGGKMRGGRRTAGIFEEVIDQDPIFINETVIPLLNTIRTDKKGRVNPKEPHAAKVFITTAGYQGTFAYEKCKDTLIKSAFKPEDYFCIGGSYEILLMHGRLTERAISDLISDPSYLPESFDREYKSIWSSAVKGAVFSANEISKLRKIVKAEFKSSEAYIDQGDFYAICADLAYDGAAETAVLVARISVGEYSFSYRFVNAFTIDGNYETVANILKEYIVRYDASLLIYDANGVGSPIREWLNKPTFHQGVEMPGYGIINPPNDVEDRIKKYKDKSLNVCYEIKSGGQKGSTIHKNFFGKMRNGSIRFLIKSSEALTKFEKNANFALGSRNKKEAAMRPYKFTDVMELQMRNLDIVDTIDVATSAVKVSRRDTKIQKDFFSAAEYLVWAVTEHLELPHFKKKKDKQKKEKQYSFVSQTSSDASSRRGGGSERRRY